MTNPGQRAVRSILSFINSVRFKDGGVDPKGGTLNPAERYATSDAANRIADALGYFKTGPNGEHLWDTNAAQNFLDPHSAAFKSLMKLANRAGSTPDSSDVSLEKGMEAAGLHGSNAFTGLDQVPQTIGQDRIKGILRNFGGEAMATDTPLQTLARAGSAAGSVSRIGRILVGDPRSDKDLSPGEQVVHTVTDLATWIGGGGEIHALGEAAGKMATQYAPKVIANVLAKQLIKKRPGRCHRRSARKPTCDPSACDCRSSWRPSKTGGGPGERLETGRS